MNTPKDLANEKLRVLGKLAKEKDEVYAEFERRSAELLKEHSQKMDMIEAVYGPTEACLLELMRKHKAAFFPEGTDQVTLEHGVLLHGHGFHVSIPRDAVASCEREGFTEAVKIVKSIDRAVVEGWEDVRLAAIGAQRKPVEKFEYELAGAEKQPQGKKQKKTKAKAAA